MIWELCGFEEKIRRVFTDKMQLNAKVDLFRDLLKPRFTNEAIALEFKDIFDKIKADIPKRNTVIHGHWGSKDEGFWLSAIASGQSVSDPIATRKRLKGKTSPILAKNVTQIAQRFSQHRVKLKRFAVKHEHLFASPDNNDPE